VIWDTLGFMISKGMEEIWVVVCSAQGKDLLGAVKLSIMRPSNDQLLFGPVSAQHLAQWAPIAIGGLRSLLQGLLPQHFMHTQCRLPTLWPGEGQ